MARDGWKDIPKYDPHATTKNKDRYFQAIADKVLQLEKQKKFSGLAFWAFAGSGNILSNCFSAQNHEKFIYSFILHY